MIGRPLRTGAFTEVKRLDPTPWARAAQSLAPLLIAVPVFVSIAVMLGRALSAAHPDLGFGTAVNGDAEALYLGHTLYQDPADGYTGQLYTPLFPLMVSLLHHVVLWAGWPLLLNYGATLSLVALTARLAYDRRAAQGPERLLSVVGAVGMGALAWWLVSALPLNLLYEGRSDHVAWAFVFFGLVLLVRGTGRSPLPLVGAGLLLSAAFWAKQTTGVAIVAAIVWVLAGAALGVMGRRRAVGFACGLIGLNLAILGVLNLATHGWEYYFDFELARRHPQFASFWPSARELFRLTGLGMGLPALLAAGLACRALAARRRAGTPLAGSVQVRALVARAGRALRESADARLVSLLVLFTLIGIPAGIYFRLKVGSDVNQYIGVVWAVGLLAAIAYRRSRAYAATALLAAAAVVFLFLVSQRPTYSVAGLWVAPVSRTQDYPELPPALIDYARSHLVYQQWHSDLNVKPQGSIYPNFYNFVDLLAGGKQPKYLVKALLDRRFDAIAPISFSDPRARLFWEIYASGAGRQEANYVWKLNEVIRAGYRPAAGLPAGFLGRRPGPSRAPWMRDCFGPFRLAGVDFGIRAGGGFWCRAGSSTVVLRRTPASFSEIHSLDPVHDVRGTLGVALPRRAGGFTVELRAGHGRAWALEGRVTAGRAISLETRVDGRPTRRALLRPVRAAGPRRVALSFRPSTDGGASVEARGRRVLALLPAIGSGDLSITASRNSRVRLDFGALALSG